MSIIKIDIRRIELTKKALMLFQLLLDDIRLPDELRDEYGMELEDIFSNE